MANILTAFPRGLNHFPFPQVLSIIQTFRRGDLIEKHKLYTPFRRRRRMVVQGEPN